MNLAEKEFVKLVKKAYSDVVGAEGGDGVESE